MKAWFGSRTGITTVTAIVVAGALAMIAGTVIAQGVSARTIAAGLLASSFFVFFVGGVMFAGRMFLGWQIADRARFLMWERIFVVSAILLTVLGQALLEDLLRAEGEAVLSRLGMLTYLFGALLVAAAEMTFLGTGEWAYPQVIAYVILAYLAQIAFGAALLQTGLTPAWAGWAAIVWNAACLLVTLVVRPRDVYYPVIHHVAPLCIGIALLTAA